MADRPAWATAPAARPTWAAAPSPVEKPAFEREAEDIASASTADIIAGQPIVTALTSAAEPVLGAAALMEKPFGGRSNVERMNQLHAMQRRGRAAMGYPSWAGTAAEVGGSLMGPLGIGAAKLPTAATSLERIVQGGAIGGASGLVTPNEKGETNALGGAGISAGLTSLLEGAFRLPGGVKSLIARFLKPKATESGTQMPGGPASKVVEELQTIRDVQQKAAPPREGAKASEFERMKKDFDERMSMAKDEAFLDHPPVDPSKALATIDELSEQKGGSIRAQLSKARETINHFVESGSAGGGVAIVTPTQAKRAVAGGRMRLEEYKAMQAGQATGKISPQQADEARQEINRLIRAKDSTGKPLDKHTQDVLASVREDLIGGMSENYKKWIQLEAAGRKELDRFKPDRNVIGKITSAERGSEPIGGSDAQRKLESVFKGAEREKELKELVDLTKHDPAQLDNLRRSLGEWVTKPDPRIKIPSPGDLVKRWDDVRSSVQRSGLMGEQHVKNIDSLVEDVRKAMAIGATKRAAATVGGFFAGLVGHHPFVGSYFARDIGAKLTKGGMEKKIAELITSGAIADADTARRLMLPPTPENVSAFAQMLGLTEREIAAMYPQKEKSNRNRLRELQGGFSVPR